MARLADRLALITGASRGLGAALAVRFAEEGARLILVARTAGGLEEVDDRVRAAGAEATLVPVDLSEPAAPDQLGRAIHERFKHLDVLVGNAALLVPLSPVAHIKPGQVERMLALNVIANQRLIRSLDPLLRAADAGRAIFVTCGEGRERRAYWGAYAASKAALETLVLSYAAETARTRLRVNLVDPGAMRTRLRTIAFPGADPAAPPAPEERTAPFVELASAGCTRHGEILRPG